MAHLDIYPFLLIISSKQLLKKVQDVKLYHVDFTYKVCKPDIPLLIIGFSDAARKFHLLAMAITRKETFEVFKFVLIKIKDWCQKINITMDVEILTSDMGKQFKKIEDFKFFKLDCWSHTKNLVKKESQKTNFEKDIWQDVDFLQLMPTIEMFNTAYNLFKEKYDSFGSLEDFLFSFDLKKIDLHSNWFEGANIYTPSTNNAIE